MKQKNILKLTAAAAAIIGAGTISFYAASEVTLAANEGKVETVATTYRVPDSSETALPVREEKKEKEEEQKAEKQDEKKKAEKQEGKGTVNYTLSLDSLNTGTPADTDLTMEEAAEIGAGYLKEIFGLDLDGAYVYMSYYPGTETFPRPFWSADVLFEKEQKPESTRWDYMVDAVTGELFNISHGRQLGVNVPLGMDAALEKDYSQYAELAKKKVTECKLIDGSVNRVEYNCQGYQCNDPTVTVDVIGENGEIVNMTFSKHDQTFLGLITDTSRKITESALEHLAGEAQDMETERVGDDTAVWKTSIVE